MKKGKLLTLVVFVLTLFCASFVDAQEEKGKTITMDFQNENMATVLKRLEKVSGYKILFTYDDVNRFTTSGKLKNVSIHEALKTIIGNKPLDFVIDGKFINVTLKQVKMKRLSRMALTKVLGIVIADEKGEPTPVIGATVKVKSSGKGAVTDSNGHFELTDVIEGEDLIVSYIGMQTRTIPAQQRVTVRMKDNVQCLDEVVVTGLFNYRAASFTGSARTYTKDDLQSVGNQNLLKSLSNLDPSFVIDDNYTNGSNPNAFNNINIRGNASFTGLQSEYDGNPNEPLFIVDGFEATREQVFDLDMNRVKSVTVLKDAAAKALYGSKAANGVVVVETKEPERGRLRLTYTGDLNVEAPDLSSYNLCNSAEKLQAELNAGRYSATSAYHNEYLQEEYNDLKTSVAQGVDTYWLAKPLRSGVGQKHSMYMEGGDDRMRYSGTFTYNGITGAMKGSDRRTISGNIKMAYRYKSLLFSNSLSVTSNKADDSPYGSFSDYSSANPYYTPYDENGNLKKILGAYTYPGSNGASSSVTYYNPLYNASIGTKNFSQYTEYTENFYIEWRPIESFRMSGRVGYTYQTNKREDFYPGDHTRFVDWTGDQYYLRGSYSITDGESATLSSDITANYTGQFGKHMILANAAWSLNANNYDTHGMTAWGFLNNHVDYITFAKQYAENGKPSGSEGTTRSIGVTGAVNYSYDDRYLADLTLRYNGSSVFGADNRWGTFWSVGLGWNIQKEKFMKSLTFVNLLKLRASYGLTGSQNFNPYQAKATYKFYDSIVYDNIVGAYLMSMPNKRLKWQQTAELNMGFDMQLFKALNVRLDVYNNKSKDALLAMTLPTSTGFNSYQENLGNVENKGFDASMNWRFIQKKDFYLSASFSIGHNVNKVTKISDALKSFNEQQQENASQNGMTSPILRYENGQSMTAIWAVQSLGIDPITGQELFRKKDGTTTYDYSYDDYIVAGDSNPKYHGNFGLSGEYKGAGLSCSFSYRTGGDYYNQTLVNRVENVDIAYNVDRRVLSDSWNKVGDIAKYKKINDTPSRTYPTTRFIEKNNELQLASFSCYYDFKYLTDFLQKIKVERLKASFYMNDLFRISTVKTERGLDYPYARSFSFSLSATF